MVTDTPAPTAKRIDTDTVIDAAMRLAADHGWDRVSLLEIAKAADVPLAALYSRFPGKHRILKAFAERIDTAVLADHDPEDTASEPARDRLFDVLMQRFDHLQPYRLAIRSVLDSYRRDPFLALGGLRQLRRSMTWMLEAADLSTGGLVGEARVAGLCGIYLATLRIWLDDDSTDMARTMAALDGYLRRIERPVAAVENTLRPGRAEAVREPEDAPGGAAAAAGGA
jgi:AcrR family transcriptional regulator